MRRPFVRAVGIVLVLVLLLLPANAHAASPLAQAQAAASELQVQIASLDGRMKSAGGRYTQAKQQLAQEQVAMAANRRDQTAAEAKLAKNQDALANFLVTVYKLPGARILNVLLSADNFTDLLNVAESISKISRQGASVISAVKSTRDQLAAKQKTLLGEQRRASKLMGQIVKEEAQITEAIQTRQALLAHAQVSVKLILRQMAAARAAAAAAAARAAAQKQQAMAAAARQKQLVAAAAAAAAAAARQRQQAAASTPAPGKTSATAGPAGYTPQSWAQSLLEQAGLPVTSANVRAIVAWEMVEGGNWFNSARYNPLNTTTPEPGAADINGIGVKAYTSWSQGLAATLATLENGQYQNIIAALKTGTDAQAVADAVAASPWGTDAFTVA